MGSSGDVLGTISGQPSEELPSGWSSGLQWGHSRDNLGTLRQGTAPRMVKWAPVGTFSGQLRDTPARNCPQDCQVGSSGDIPRHNLRTAQRGTAPRMVKWAPVGTFSGQSRDTPARNCPQDGQVGSSGDILGTISGQPSEELPPSWSSGFQWGHSRDNLRTAQRGTAPRMVKWAPVGTFSGQSRDTPARNCPQDGQVGSSGDNLGTAH